MSRDVVSTKSSAKKVWLWALYDFANSLAFITVSFYFSLWIVKANKLPDVWVSVPVALSTLLLLLTLPTFGAISDRLKKRMPFLTGFTLISIISLFVIGLIGINTKVLASSSILIVAGLYLLFQYSFQASLAFHSAFIQDLSSGRSKEKLSGLAMAAGQFGNIVGLMIMLPIAQKKFDLFGVTGQSGTFVIAALLFLVIALPVMLFLKDTKKAKTQKTEVRIGKTFLETLQSIRNVRKYPGLLSYLVAYFLFADAILTLQLFSSLYLDKVGGLDDSKKTMAFIGGLVLAIIGALISRWLTKVFKGTRRTIGVFIAFWAAIIAIYAIVSNPSLMLGIVMLNGFAFGVLFSLSRAYFSDIVPSDKQAEFFGVYVLFERFAAILGPLLWSTALIKFASSGDITKYRYAMLLLAVLVAISFVVFQFGKPPKKIASSVS